MTNSHCFIVASSKYWHSNGFNDFVKRNNEQWYYISTEVELANAVEELKPRYVFFLHWNSIVSPGKLASTECVCFHMTDLPYGRGGSPLQNLILNGRTETMLTALRMSEELDAGPVYCKRPMTLEGNAEEIYLRAGGLCWDMIRWIVDNQPVPMPQSGEVTRFKRRKPEQSELPKRATLDQLFDFIRMLDAPTYPKAFIRYGDHLLEFRDAQVRNGELTAVVTFKQFNGEEVTQNG